MPLTEITPKVVKSWLRDQHSDVDFAARRLTVRRSYSGPTKAGKVRTIALMQPAVEALESQQALGKAGNLVFPSTRKKLPSARPWAHHAYRLKKLHESSLALVGPGIENAPPTRGFAPP